MTTPRSKHRRPDRTETGTVRKPWAGRSTVALAYPNTYSVGMSNLGFQTVYDRLNRMEDVVCERVFLPGPGEPPRAIESGRRLPEFDVIAFSVSFENDYPNLIVLLDAAGLPVRSADRNRSHPLVIAGGVACMLNPEPIAPFVDLFLLGEAEPMLSRFADAIRAETDTPARQNAIARHVPGAYVPARYTISYHGDGTIRAMEPVGDAPPRIRRAVATDLSDLSTCSAILTPDTPFDRTYLVEVSRGCPHGCRFCSAGFIYRPSRYRPLQLLERDLEAGCALTDRIGLVGAAVSDLPDLERLCSSIDPSEIRISFSSLRADALTPGLIKTLRESRVKTATIAPDAGSQRMRTVINKGLDEKTILDAAESLVAGGIPNLKLYFMVGLPSETLADVDAVVALCKRIKHRFLKSSRARGRIGEMTVTLSSFVPKPFTPFQWAPMDPVGTLKQKIRRIKDGLKPVANIRVHADIPRWSYIQAILSRGDRRVADMLMLAHRYGGNWAQALKASPLNPDFYAARERGLDECLPWDFIDHGIRKSFLRQEYRRALKGKSSPPCPAEGCVACGACGPGSESTTS